MCTPMFIGALFSISETWKKLKCPPKDKWLKKMSQMYTREHYSEFKINELSINAAIWMNLQVSEKDISIRLYNV